MTATYSIWVSGYGVWNEEFATREEAEERAKDKAVWEKAPNHLVWRRDGETEFDRLTQDLADLWASGSGAPTSLLRARGAAKRALGQVRTPDSETTTAANE